MGRPRLDLSDEQRRERILQQKRDYNKRNAERIAEQKKAKKEEKRQKRAEEKADLADCLRDLDAPDAVKAAVLNEKHGFGIIEGVQRGEKRVVILEHISGGCGETRFRVKETVYSFFPSRADALAYCHKNAKRMKFYI